VLRSLIGFGAGSSAGSAPVTAHVDFLGALFVVWGMLTATLGVSTLLLGVGAAHLVASSEPDDRLAAGLVAGALFAMALIAILWGVAHVAVGVPVRRHRPWARLAALMLGTVDLLLFPYGTALGAYALWVLLGEQRRTLFEPTV
jgi:hypothetical protein